MRVAASFRAVRLRLGMRQSDVARAATVNRSTVSLIERGQWDRLSHRTLVQVADVLQIRVGVIASWRGSDLDRLLNADHSRLHERVAGLLGARAGWYWQPEVSFSIWGERGVIDILAFHPPTGSLLVIELKTEIVDAQDLVGTIDRRVRLAQQIAAERGWAAHATSAWVVVADTRTNRRRLAAHRLMLRTAFPADGRAIRAWLHVPSGTIRSLSFLPLASDRRISRRRAAVKRVRAAA